MITSRTRRPAAVAAGAALLLALGACSEEKVVPTADTGDCIESISTGLVSQIDTVDCDDPHEAQVVGTFDHEDGDFPGADAISATANEKCATFFEEFVGAPFLETNLSIRMLNPTEETWNEADDRETICIVVRDDGADLTESVEDNAENFRFGS